MALLDPVRMSTSGQERSFAGYETFSYKLHASQLGADVTADYWHGREPAVTTITRSSAF